jgi:biopolymer transport protein ExbB/biopolymer transport protein TolQ
MLLFKLNFLGMLLLQEVGFDLRSMWAQMGFTAKAVVVLLAVMSAWSIGVMIDRYLAFSAARKQSREFAPAVAGCLKEGKIEEAISVAEQNKKSHLAKVVEAGLQEFRAHSVSRELSGEQVESSRRA